MINRWHRLGRLLSSAVELVCSVVGYGQEEHVHIRFNSVIGVFIVINSRRRINSKSLSFSLNCFGGSFMDMTGGYYIYRRGTGEASIRQ